VHLHATATAPRSGGVFVLSLYAGLPEVASFHPGGKSMRRITCVLTLMLASCAGSQSLSRSATRALAPVILDITAHAAKTQDGGTRRGAQGRLTRSGTGGRRMNAGRSGRNASGPPQQSAAIIQEGPRRMCRTRSVRNDLRNGGRVSIPRRQRNEDAQLQAECERSEKAAEWFFTNQLNPGLSAPTVGATEAFGRRFSVGRLRSQR
jgi:hypothetical protein